ncbi:MAG TPA: MFS transporter [Candidatus Binatia bacterium]|nr:MFS transporter [Candidatus Binatia bacterium]
MSSTEPAPTVLGESPRAWVALLVGVLAVSAHSASSLAVSVLMKSMVEEFAWSRSQFASAMTIRIFAITLTMPFAGQMADRFGARTVLAGGAMVVGSCLLALREMHSLAEFWGISLLMGPGQACIGSVAASALVLRLFKRHRGIAVGVLNGGDNILNSMVPLAAVSLLASGGWRVAVGGLAAVYLALAGGIVLALRGSDGRSADAAHAGSWSDLPWRDARLWVLCLVYAAIYAWVTSIQLHFYAYQTDSGHSMEVASRLLSIQLLVGAIGAPIFGWLAERTSARTALLVSVVGLTMSAFLLWSTTDVRVMTAWAVFHGLVNSGVVAVLALVLHELFGPERIGRLMGVAMFFCMGATLLGNQWSAWMFDTFGSYLLAWQAYSVLMLVTIAPVVWLRRARA